MHRAFPLALALTLLSAPAPTWTQQYGASSFEEEAFRSITARRKGPEPPPIELRAAGEIPIPGPVRDGDLETVGAEVRVRVAEGMARIRPNRVDGDVRIQPVLVVETAETLRWVRGGRGGRMRFRTDPDGGVIAQKRARGSAGRWHDSWRLRVPGSTPAAPLTIGGKVFVGSSDSRIYALRARNGHRLWARDVGERLVRPLAHWHGSLGEPEFDLLVAVPADGRQVLVVDPFDGRTLASYRLPDTGESLATGPAVTPDGRVAVAVQKYDEKAAALLLLEIRPARTEPGAGDMPYNGGGLDEVEPERPEGGKAKR